ncbi:MAG: hypothetical protein M1838_003921 [Thelocarpon superellum]|nr:MAG: hypothetical protein M1838_003921 [Thelocarpon superellum]
MAHQPRPERPGLVWRVGSSIVMAVTCFLMRFLLYGANRTSVEGLDGFVRILDQRSNVDGRERGLLTVGNHISVLDDPLTFGVLPFRHIRSPDSLRWGLGAHDIAFRHRGLSTFWALGQVLPTHRLRFSEHGGPFQATMTESIRLLSDPSEASTTMPGAYDGPKTVPLTYTTDGMDAIRAPSAYRCRRHSWIHVFPEGKCSQFSDMTMRYFKWGISRLILEADALPQIVPIWVEGMDQVMREDRTAPRALPRWGKEMTIFFGDEVDGEGVFGDLRRRWQALCRAASAGPSAVRQERGVLTEQLKYGAEAVNLRIECAGRVRELMLELRRRRGFPDEDPATGLAETWKAPSRPTSLAADPEHSTERIFVASVHWNNEIILRSHWNNAVLDLVRHFGTDNIYVSVFQSGSYDHSADAVTLLDEQLGELGAQRSVINDNTTHADEIAKEPAAEGWIDIGHGRKRPRRIPYLAGLRNRSLEPLRQLAEQGIFFDKILFPNDVIFTTDDVLTLLHTRDGDYAAACALDFSKPPYYYDTFALRDAAGAKTVTQSFPYFASRASRMATMAGEPVPVQSCWNGMVVFDAAPFYTNFMSSHTVPSTAHGPQRPLRFRGTADSLAAYHLEASECCLIHYDNPLSRVKGVWVNPQVRVAYNAQAWETIKPPAEGEARWPSLAARWAGMWWNRAVRILNMYTSELEAWTVRSRVRQWQKAGRVGAGEEEQRMEPGMACLVNEMQVLAVRGWAHV